MVARGPGDVGCAHCAKFGADRACQVCTRLVCEACAADWSSCDQPSGRVVRLGLTARVRDIDPLGRYALVSHWRKPLRLFDLRQLHWVEGSERPRRLYALTRHFPPRLTSDGLLVYAKVSLVTGEALVEGINWDSLRHPALCELVAAEAPTRGSAVSAVGDRYSYLTDTQRIVVMHRRAVQTPPQSTHAIAFAPQELNQTIDVVVQSYEPLQRRVIQAAYVDGERDLIASATWAELALHRIVDGKLELLSRMPTALEGGVAFIAVAGPCLVAAVHRPAGGTQLEVHRLTESLEIGPVEDRIIPTGVFQLAALSSDGRHLAIALEDGRLVVHDLVTRDRREYFDHTDRINYLRFASDDHLLISADTDNRIVLRPRAADGYVQPLLPVELAT